MFFSNCLPAQNEAIAKVINYVGLNSYDIALAKLVSVANLKIN